MRTQLLVISRWATWVSCPSANLAWRGTCTVTVDSSATPRQVAAIQGSALWIAVTSWLLSSAADKAVRNA